MSGTRSKNYDLPRFVVKTKTGAYKYQRRVPPDLQQALSRKVWDYSLGSEPTEAYRRAGDLRVKHDTLIAAMRDTESPARFLVAQRRSQALFAQRLAEGAPDAREDQGDPENGGAPFADAMPNDTGTFEALTEGMWKRVPAILEGSDWQTPEARTMNLSFVAAAAFGDNSRAKLPDLPVISPPTGKVAAMQHGAHKAMLDSVLEELDPTPDTTPEDQRLSGIVKAYLESDSFSENTKRSYTKKVQYFTDSAGDRALDAYTSQMLRDYRDKLKQTLKPASLNQYFAALKTLWKWASAEHDVRYSDLSFPNANLAKRKTKVEDDNWLAFSDPQIKEVWRLLNVAWGPEAKSRLTPSRRAAFLMATRVMLWSGLRPVEVWHITAESVKGDVIHIKKTKTGAQRTLPLSKHLADLPAFLGAGGFAAELAAGEGRMYRGEIQATPTTPESIAGTMRDNFRKVIHAGGIKDERLVLYSLKHTLVRKLQVLLTSPDLQKAVIGHISEKGALRNYKTLHENDPKLFASIREALDAVEYW